MATIEERKAQAVVAALQGAFPGPNDPDWGDGHIRGDLECASCWRGYPRPCECGGLIHTQFEDEICTDDDEFVILKYKCDGCGDDSVEA